MDNTKQVKLTPNQADAIKSEMQEIGQMQAALQLRVATYSRFVRAIVLDAGHKPDDFTKAGLWEEGGEIYLRGE